MSRRFETIQAAKLNWRDGVPYSPLFDDVYFSRCHGLAETEHVFIHGNHLPSRFAALPPSACFIIAETGFGTGLNFLTAWHYWRQHAPSQSKLFYYTTELHPLTREDLVQCSLLWPELSTYSQQLLDAYPVLTPGFHQLSFDEDRVHLILMLGDVIDCYQQLIESGDFVHETCWRGWSVDAWFLDGFAPAKNARMWQDELFQTMAFLSDQNTTFSSYTAAGQVRHALTKNGFEARLVTGFGQKRHMLQGCFGRIGGSERDAPLGRLKTTPWYTAKAKPKHSKQAIIIGGGLSGCFMAHVLAKRGYQIQLLETGSQIASKGSANQHAILYPKLSAFSAPFTQWMLQSFLHAKAFYKPLVDRAFEGKLNGILQFAHHAREQKTQGHLQAMLSCYPELARFVSKEEASRLAGIPVLEEALYIPDAGWINVPQLCHYLIQHPAIHVHAHCDVSDLQCLDHDWHVGEYLAPIVILANAMGMLNFEQTAHLPLKANGGGLSFMAPHHGLEQLKLPLCGNGHLMPLIDGVHAVGATYHLYNYQDLDVDAEHRANGVKVHTMPLDRVVDLKPLAYWGDVRVATTDYLPVVGGVAPPASFKKQYLALMKNVKQYIPAMPDLYSGLYVFTGFGSRGLCTIPLASEYLAGLIHGEPAFLPRTLRQALSPQRFLLRELVRM